MGIAELIIVGLIVGAVARLLVPGRQSMGILMTLAVGVGGSLLGWWLGSKLGAPSAVQYPWLWAVGGAVLLVLAWSAMQRRGIGRRRGLR